MGKVVTRLWQYGKTWKIEDMLKMTVRKGSCLIFTGSTRGQMGYAQFPHSVGTGSRYGHIEIWLWRNKKRKVPDGLDVMHSCDRPACINWRHLSIGTRAANLKQMRDRGRHFTPFRKGKTSWNKKRMIGRSAARITKR